MRYIAPFLLVFGVTAAGGVYAQQASSPTVTIQTPEGAEEYQFTAPPEEAALAAVEDETIGQAHLFSGLVLVPDAALAEAAKTHKIELASIDGWPEVKMGTKRECVGGGWSRVCFNRPQPYHRKSKLTLYGQVIMPTDINQRVEGVLRGCVLGALGGAIAASIITSPAGSIPAFKVALVGCLSNSAEDLAGRLLSEVHVSLYTETVPGEWHPV